jgi:hypothetical protein
VHLLLPQSTSFSGGGRFLGDDHVDLELPRATLLVPDGVVQFFQFNRKPNKKSQLIEVSSFFYGVKYFDSHFLITEFFRNRKTKSGGQIEVRLPPADIRVAGYGPPQVATARWRR